MTAPEFCTMLAQHYHNKPDSHQVSIGDWDRPEPDPGKMTIYTLPEFSADISVTVGQLRDMAGVKREEAVSATRTEQECHYSPSWQAAHANAIAVGYTGNVAAEFADRNEDNPAFNTADDALYRARLSHGVQGYAVVRSGYADIVFETDEDASAADRAHLADVLEASARALRGVP
jgi:hypothetical protein